MTTKKKPSNERLIRLREQREEMAIAAEIASLQSQVEAHRWAQAGIAAESYTTSEFVNRRDWRPPEIQRSGWAANDSTLSDRRQGRNEPFVQTEHDVNVIRGIARLVCESTSTGKAIERNLKNYVIGFGLNHEVSPKKPKDIGPDGLKEDVQEFVDQFLESNRWDAELDRELFWRAIRDGERFVPTFPSHGGTMKVRQLEPEQVQDPGGDPFQPSELVEHYHADPEVLRAAGSWSFGIHTKESDIQTVWGYHIRWDDLSGSDYLPECYCLHAKRNVDRNVKRGMSDFYPAWKKIISEDKLENRTGSGSAARAGIAYIVQHAQGATASTITSLNAGNSQYTRQRDIAGGTTEEQYVQEHEGATRLDVSAGKEYMQGMVGTDPAMAALEVMNRLARSVGKIWCMPEHMITGDASNNNYASILEAGNPFANMVGYEQWSYAEFKKEIIWRAIKHATECGRFSRWGNDGSYWALKRRFAVNVTPPDIKEGDRLAETQRRQVLKDAGVISLTQWTIEEGYDPEEQAAMRSEEATNQPGGQPSGEFGALGRRQFTNNTKAVDDILAGFKDQSRTEVQALQMLQAIGMSPERAQALLDDAKPEPAAETAFNVRDVDLALEIMRREYP